MERLRLSEVSRQSDSDPKKVPLAQQIPTICCWLIDHGIPHLLLAHFQQLGIPTALVFSIIMFNHLLLALLVNGCS